MQEYEEKRANLRQKYGAKNPDDTKEALEENNNIEIDNSSNLKPEANNNLSNSIAAMNSSITEKWRKINTKGAGGLNNTVGGGFKSSMQDKSTLDKESNENEVDQDTSSISKMALQARLNEVKARLGKIKKTHDQK